MSGKSKHGSLTWKAYNIYLFWIVNVAKPNPFMNDFWVIEAEIKQFGASGRK